MLLMGSPLVASLTRCGVNRTGGPCCWGSRVGGVGTAGGLVGAVEEDARGGNTKRCERRLQQAGQEQAPNETAHFR